MANSGFMEFGFGDGDDNVGGGKFERFKGKEGENYRPSFVWWPKLENGRPNLDAESPRFVAVKRLYIPNVGFVVDTHPELAKYAESPAKPAIATILAFWPLDKKGQVDRTRFMEGDVDVLPWVFSKTIYDQLKKRHTEWHLGKYDQSLTCTDTKYQKMDFAQCKENLYRKVLETERMASVVDAIVKRVASIEEGIQGSLAREMTIEQVRAKLGQAPAMTSGPGGAASGGGSTANVDAILNDLLDP